MSELLLPAPISRRLAAAVYDFLLVLALIMASLLVSGIPLWTLHIPTQGSAAWAMYCNVLVLTVGLAFFGWFWTHGGQTAGMLAWRLRVRREDGAPLRWPVAFVRYAAMVLCWLTALTPTLALLPAHLRGGNAMTLVVVSVVFTVLGLLSTVLDGRKRAPHDRLSSCEVVLLPPRQRAPQAAG